MEGFSVEEPSETPAATSLERSPQHFDLSAEDPTEETEGTSSFEQAFEKDPAASGQGRGLEDARQRWGQQQTA